MEKKSLDLLFGKRNFFEFLEASQSLSEDRFSGLLREVLVKDSLSNEEKQRIRSLVPNTVKFSTVSVRELDKITQNQNHQGYVLIRNRQKSFSALNLEAFKANISIGMGPILLLDRIQDPGNLGNLIRTAECLGVKEIVLTDRDTAPISPVVEKASSGAIHHVRLYRVSNLSHVIEHLKKKEYWVLATDEEGDEELWEDLPEASSLAIMMGNEGEGIKRILLEDADYIGRIPLLGSVTSLNVVVACGITLDRIQR